MPEPAAPVPIGPLTAEERPAFTKMLVRAFGETADDALIEHANATELADPARSLAARDGDRIVGTTTIIDFEMTVPGADPVECAGVTSVAVAPTHRRRGVATGLMRRQLDDIHEAGTAWASLYASEMAIYGRFGYGVAARSLQFKLDGPWTAFVVPAWTDGIELIDAADAAPRVADLYERVRHDVPGTMSAAGGGPSGGWEQHFGYDPPDHRKGATARQVAALGDRGVLVYRLDPSWSDSGPDGTIRVELCLATDVDALRALWTYAFGIDLVQHMTAWLRPVDDPLPWWLAERRRLQLSESMSLYIRLVDVGAALSQRGTAASGAVVLDVADAFCPWNARRWQLEGDGKALHCTPGGQPADIALDARELASLSLGGVTPFELERAGLIEERRPGALATLAALLASQRAPFNPFVF